MDTADHLQFAETAGWDGWVIVRVGNLSMREMFTGAQEPYRVVIERVKHSDKISHVHHPCIAVRRHALLRIAAFREKTREPVPLVRIGKWTGKPLNLDCLRVLPLVLCRRVRWI